MKKGEIKKWFEQKMKYMGIKNKTLLRVSVVIIFFMFIFITIFVSLFSRRLEQKSIIYSENLLKNTNGNIISYIDEISALANEANFNYYLQNFLMSERENQEGYSSLTSGKSMQDYEMSSKLFSNSLNNRTDVSSIMIFGEKRVLLYRSIYTFWSIIQDYSEENWYQKAMKSKEGSVITGPQNHEFLLGNTEKTISLSRKISSYEDGSFLGVILVDLNLNRIEEICASNYSENEGELCLVNQDGELVYQHNSKNTDFYDLEEESIIKSLNSKMQSAGSNHFRWKVNDKEYQVVSSKIDKANWTALSITPVSAINQSLYENLAIFLVISISILIIIIIVLNILLKKIVKPLVSLTEHMDIAQGGNLNVRASIESYDETGRLTKSFNELLERIKFLMSQVVTEQEDKRKYELQMLQAQINPHFLYNTLDSIIWMAEMKDESVVPMTEALAKLFRISLNKGNEFISIQDELEHVRNYLVIQSMRYLDKFEYHIVISDEVKEYKTVKLIIQPIVENCIYHGIKKKKGKGNITITAVCRGDDIIIKVSDNGVGMEPESCENILVGDVTSENISGSGIGVKNVNERIKIHFGENYGLSFESALGKGTTVSIKIPKIKDPATIMIINENESKEEV